jgi:alpha-amylase
MATIQMDPAQVEFVILSFEGPDRYALAGGLGVRATNLAETLACQGYQTHLIFVGDPALPGVETQQKGRLHLYRWCQWLSAYHPSGVYDGEESKIADYNASVPPFIVENIVRPAAERGRSVVVLAEEWHTAQTLILLSDQLHQADLRRFTALLWNANNTMGFERIDWIRLGFVSTLTTVSRYMKQIMRARGQDALIIPNGIPSRLLDPVPQDAVDEVRRVLAGSGELLLLKVGRFDPAKCWWMSTEAIAMLKRSGETVRFLCRGGIEPYGWEVLQHARELGLVVKEVCGSGETWQQVLAAIESAGPADLYSLRFSMPQEVLRVFFAAVDFVIANSKHEPFGLVGLEAMAVGGLVFTGPTGETYSADGGGAIALDSETPDELFLAIQELRGNPARAREIRAAAPKVAANFTWENVLKILFEKIQLAGRRQNNGQVFGAPLPANRLAQDVVVYTVVHQPRRLRLPAQPIPPDASPEQIAGCLFDEEMNRRYFEKVAQRCYWPAAQKFLELVENSGLKLTIGFSMSFIEQAMRWDPALMALFKRLVAHPNVDLAAVEPYHSFLLLWDIPHFASRMELARDQLGEIFGKFPQVADTTELMMSDPIYHTLDQLGFKGAFMDGRPWVMEWRQPTYLYTHNQADLCLLTRHYQLSDDVGFRFSNRGWSGWPLMADTYAGWISRQPGDTVLLGWDFETFGEHHNRESGIFEFLETFVKEAQSHGMTFRSASEVLERHADHSCELPLPVNSSTWAGSGGMEFFLGNPAQQAVLHLMLAAYNKALLTGSPEMIDLALWLAQSDNLHLIQWYGRQGSEAEVSAYFTPGEWWNLGGEQIIREIQKVYQNFVWALDGWLPHKIAPAAAIIQQPARREQG